MPVSPIVVQNDSLARGIESAGSSIGQALDQRMMDQRRKEELRQSATTLGSILKTLPENPTIPQIQDAMTQAISQGVPPELIKQQLDYYAPMLKQQAEMASTMGLMNQINGIQQPSQQPGQITTYPSEGLLSNALKNSSEERITPISSIKQAQAFSRAPDDLQRSFIQQNGGINNLSNDQLKLLSIIPNKGINNLVDTELKIRGLEQAGMKEINREQAAIRSENRNEIRKFAEPFQDIQKFESNVNKLKEAEKLIDTRKVSIDDQWLRTAVMAIAEGKESVFKDIAKTPEQQKLWYLLRDSLKPKELGGTNPSTREVLIAMESLPSGYKSYVANKYIIRNMINQAELDLQKSKEISRLRSENENIPFSKFQQNLNESLNNYSENQKKQFDKYMQIINANETIKGQFLRNGYSWMLDPQGNVRQVPKESIEKAKKSGGILLGENNE